MSRIRCWLSTCFNDKKDSMLATYYVVTYSVIESILIYIGYLVIQQLQISCLIKDRRVLNTRILQAKLIIYFFNLDNKLLLL